MAQTAPELSPSSDDLLIDVRHVSKSYGEHPVIRDISMEVSEGEVVCIIGVSGCGKSTLLKLIGGLETPDDGEIILGDPNVAFVFQYSALFDSLNVFENVAFSLLEEPDQRQKKRPTLKPREIRAQAEEKLRLVGLEGIEDKLPSELSGGMKKRVSFARAIMSNPRIILYDEPTAGLDPIASTMIEDYILKLRDELGAASVVVTHQHSTIQRTADRVLLLHEGVVQWSGSPKELLSSDNPYARQFSQASLEGPLAD
ncbi:MAG: ATP-binding cassette domain-containing protein [Vampirovibrionales bacterium]|nr:ATP-binding cassette domain-containing protein [Vampirovibrionales bacterium]